MESKVQNGIKDVGYNGAIKEPSVFAQSIEEGAKNIEYTKFVNFLTHELRSLCNIDEEVNCITAPEDAVSFMMELGSFLKELGCPHECLTQGHISDRLESKEDKILLLDYLLTELMAARVLQEKKPDKKIELKLRETPQAANLKKMLVTLRFPKPPSNISVPNLFQKLNPTVQNLVQKAGDELLGHPICNFTINDRQWDTLHKIEKDLHEEYKIRREMLLKRLDCTIQSFQWSDKMKGKDELINKQYTEKRKHMKVEPDVSISDLLAAREDLAIIEKTSSASVRKNTQTSINKVIIGQVPDRGGRTSEQAPPPPEMPSWQQQRQPGPSGGGGRGGQRGGQRGGRGRGGGDFNRGGGQSNYQQNNYDNNRRGSYDNNQGGYNNYNRGGGSQSQRSSFDSAGGYSTGYGGSYSSNNYSNYENKSFDSAGSYGGNKSRDSYGYQSEPKRPKTYDSFQANKTTYADQYVQESQQNQRFQPRGGGGGGRGGGRSYYNQGSGSSGGRQNYY